MAKAIDPARFMQRVTSKAMEQLTSTPGPAHFNEGALVRVTLARGVIRGYVIGHAGSEVDKALWIRTGRAGRFRIFEIPLHSPDLIAINVIRDFSWRRGTSGIHGKVKSKVGKRPGVHADAWHYGQVVARTHATGSRALAGAVKRAVAETVAEDQVTFIGNLEPATVALAERISSMVGDIRDASSNARIEKLVELMLPATDPVAEIRAKIEVDNATLRQRFLTEVPALTAADVAEAAGSKAANKSATANRWKSSGQIFSVTQAGREIFPAFQFDHGAPRPVIGKILAVLQPHRSAWETAFWFVSSNPWLDGKAPIDRLEDEEAVLRAAERAAEGLQT